MRRVTKKDRCWVNRGKERTREHTESEKNKELGRNNKREKEIHVKDCHRKWRLIVRVETYLADIESKY